ncbi:sarcosine oxidase subunit alpha [Terrihabitans soli]|uniref:Sarcosine oxidase subunit alpha n=1 Tax=Terrihabitans soli TaxID=708113 RepID=A0A6S6QLT7_9HYPH|nr:sarcosine oxidase subunit alpha family protein [Terrihabitans soli]BCJ92303.1 sarcosine oxidase subunit alpha [Terrihabitans soli]
MSQSHRTRKAGLIDRTNTFSFSFDGHAFDGYPGDTLASALIANGVRLVGRSFKYHRPRGIFSDGSQEPNALVELRDGARREPNTKATGVELYEGLVAASQNRWPSLAFDLRAAANLVAPFIPAGFYYKTFMWPSAFWEKLYEPAIRRAAGLGALSGEDDPDIYEKSHAFCDLLIIGAGPAGLTAALAAGRAGIRVILCDEDFALGGRLLSETYEIGGASGSSWARHAAAELATLSNVRILKRTTVFGVYDGGTYGAIEKVADHKPAPRAGEVRQRTWKIVAKRAILAAGATERPIAFGGNDVPGVMLGSAIRTFVNRFAATPGWKTAIFTSSDDGWRTASDLLSAGVEISAIVDSRPDVSGSVRALGRASLQFLGSVIQETQGKKGLKSIIIRDEGGQKHLIEADALAVSNGWNPQIGLTTHLGGRPVWDTSLAAFVPGALPNGMCVAGAAAGRFPLSDAMHHGAHAVEKLGFETKPVEIPQTSEDFVSVTPLWHIGGSKKKAFVDFQNDVTVDDIALSAREGFRSVEHLKRYTTLGMATDQGKSSNVNGLAILATLTGREIPETGTTVTRPPHVPVAIGALAGIHTGRAFKPFRLTSGHRWAERNGAVFVEAGQWLRPQWFAQAGEKDWLESVVREVNTVRNGVGICDVSTLGKIDIQGKDAGALLDRVYINMFSTLAVGKARYGMMLREDGMVLDDGTTARFSDTRYVMSTTTANAGRVMQHLEFCRQVLWPELDVQTVSITEHWAQYAVAGPKSRALLEAFFGGKADLSDEAFPYMAVGEFDLSGVPVRLFRLSFSGERAYEIAVPARYGAALLERLIEAGKAFGVTPYGTEALSVMRIEKGHVAGNEINGQTTAADLGMGRMMSKKKDFLGRVLAARPGLADPERPALAGFKPLKAGERLRAGAHFIGAGKAATAANDEGYMTSVAYSPTTGHWIGLGVITRGPERYGERVRAYDPVRGGDVEVEICAPCFVDPEGAKLHA